MSPLPLDQTVASVTRSDHDATWIDLGIDPAAADRIGDAVAALARDRGVDLVVSWDDEDDVVLAHATARALPAPRIVVQEDMGLMSVSRPVEGARAVLVATRLSRHRPLDAVSNLLTARGIRLVLAVELLASDESARSARASAGESAAELLVISLAGGN